MNAEPQNELLLEPIQYDQCGRMKYHPIFHPKRGEKYSESDLEYLCKYWETDGYRCLALALGRPEASLSSKVAKLKSEGKFKYYKHLK